MDWRAALIDNWPYKVAALALAVLLWFNVSADQDRTEQSVTTALQFQFPDEGWVPVEVPTEVRTTFRGRLGDILGLPGDVAIRHTIDEVGDSVVTVDLDPSMVHFDRRLNVQPVNVRPSSVEVRFDRIAEKRVPVTIDVSATAADGFTIVGAPIVEPETVTVRGARGEVETVSHVETEPVALDGLEASTTRQLELRTPGELETLGLEPDHVLATLRVDSLVERRFWVSLRAVGPGAAGVTLSPPAVELILRGPSGEVDDLSVREMSATVRVDAVPEEVARRPVEVSLPEGVSATAEVSPTAVRVIPGGAAGATTSDTSATGGATTSDTSATAGAEDG